MSTARRLRFAVLAAAILLLLAQVVATAMLLDRSRGAALTAATDTADRVGRAVESSINRSFVQVDAMLAGLPAILAPYARDGRFDANAAGRVMRELNNQNFTFRDVLLVREDGMPITTSLSVSRRRPLPLPLGAAFTDATPNAGSVMIGGPVQNPATGEWALFFARPVTMPVLGQITAVAEVPVPMVGSLLAVGGNAPGLRITLEREDGTLLASMPHDETRIGRRLAQPASALAGLAQARSRFNEEPVLIAVRPTLYPSLSIVTTIELAAALEGWRTDRERALIVSAAFAALVLALAAALLLGLRQREKVEAERSRWRSTLENALESMSDGFVMFGPDDRLLACNQRYKEFYAISAPFIKAGAAFRDIMREGAKRGQYPQAVGDIEAFVDEMDNLRHANNPPIERLLLDGRWVLITERSTPDGGTVGIRTDITPLKRAMDDLAQARDSARAAGEAKSQFLARMSHELRTPLNGVLGFAQVLLRDRNLSEEQRDQVVTLHEAGRHLLELVNSLLDLSKIEAGKLDLHLRHVAVRPLLEACAGLLAPEVDRKGMTLDLHIAPGTPAAVEADATRVRQMLLNLLSNAVKFTPPGGRVDFRAGPMPDGRQGLRMEVADNGPGVPPEKRHLLFEDFSQLFPVAGQDGAGTGLGLAISARLAAAMGGRIGCDSESGQGARFWVELPLKEVPLPEAAALPSTTSLADSAMALQGRSLRILVADDVAANRMVARAMLVGAGHRVDSAADGAEALAAVQREAYDVVLMDVQMPVMDGLEATRRIRALDTARRRVPVLAVTASALPEQVAACHAAGMDGHLAKPIDRESLLAAVARLAAGDSMPGSSATPSVDAQQPLLDPSALRNLAADLGPTAEVVITEFVAEVRFGYETLSVPGIADDIPRLRHAAHRMLGAARTLGARRLGALTEALQKDLHAEQDPAEALRLVLETAAATLPLIEAPLERTPHNDTGNPSQSRRLAQGVGD
jgi:signal transduction histidine kinase/CheY-like chemotaxis protein